jgi:lipopolysaccharide/colanic/teichoic acid biosynthesis glycosyltransferase
MTAAKRAIDVVMASALLLVVGPVMAVVALLIRRSCGKPVLFRQTRIGLRGKPFILLKFRTMRSAGPGEGDAVRLTPLGEWLRATSLDELPQLWNVLRGDMSFVGPRPLLPQYLSRYSREQSRRHDVLPGITGLAQVSGRNALDWDRKFELDVWYVDHQSLVLDLQVLCRTAIALVRRDGIAAEGHATMPEFMGTAARPEAKPPIEEGGTSCATS